MKLMFASDIHGSSLWCGKLLEAYRRENAEKLFLLGDILYHGPRNDLPDGYSPKKVIKQLNAMRSEIICVRGNCDTEVDQMVLAFPIMAEYMMIFADGRNMFLAHGHNFTPEFMPPLEEGDVLINGHTHIPMVEKTGGIHCLNVGSVSMPKDGSPHSYMTYENGTFILRDIDGGEIIIYPIPKKRPKKADLPEAEAPKKPVNTDILKQEFFGYLDGNINEMTKDEYTEFCKKTDEYLKNIFNYRHRGNGRYQVDKLNEIFNEYKLPYVVYYCKSPGKHAGLSKKIKA